MNPMTTRLGRPTARATAVASSADRSSSWALGRNARPASVSWVPCVVRSKSRTPNSPSSRRT